jgi:hypothetical protein
MLFMNHTRSLGLASRFVVNGNMLDRQGVTTDHVARAFLADRFVVIRIWPRAQASINVELADTWILQQQLLVLHHQSPPHSPS